MRLFLLFYFALLFALVYGWVMNLINIVDTLGDPVTTLSVARFIGIFIAPFGAILGYAT